MVCILQNAPEYYQDMAAALVELLKGQPFQVNVMHQIRADFGILMAAGELISVICCISWPNLKTSSLKILPISHTHVGGMLKWWDCFRHQNLQEVHDK